MNNLIRNRFVHHRGHADAFAALTDPDTASKEMIEIEMQIIRRIPNPDAPAAEAWFTSLHALETFIDQERRFPSRLSTDLHERSLATWLAHERTIVRTDFQILRLVPYILTPDILVSNWWVALAELERFVIGAQRMPDRDSSDELERGLAAWVRSVSTRQLGQRKLYAFLSVTDWARMMPRRLTQAAEAA